jgi:hypothetical protein
MCGGSRSPAASALALVALLIACRDPQKDKAQAAARDAKARTSELEATLRAANIELPPAGEAPKPLPDAHTLVMVSRDKIWVDDSMVVRLDPARAATDGVDARYVRPGTMVIVPLDTAVRAQKDLADRRKAAANAVIAASADAPRYVLDEVVATMADVKVDGTYRLVRLPDRTLGVQPMTQ